MGSIRIFKNINYLFITEIIVGIVFLSLTFFANISIFYNVLFDSELEILTKINIIANIPYGYISEFSHVLKVCLKEIPIRDDLNAE